MDEVSTGCKTVQRPLHRGIFRPHDLLPEHGATQVHKFQPTRRGSRPMNASLG